MGKLKNKFKDKIPFSIPDKKIKGAFTCNCGNQNFIIHDNLICSVCGKKYEVYMPYEPEEIKEVDTSLDTVKDNFEPIP